MMKGTFGRLLRGGQAENDSAGPSVDTPLGRLSAFFKEIESTSAARRLTIKIGDAEMTFDMANKKVLKLVDMVPDADGRGKIAAEIVRNYDQLDSQLKLLAELITTFVALPGEFDIASRPAPVNYPAKMDGFPAAEWRFACDLYGIVPSTVAAKAVADPVQAPEAEPVAEVVAAQVAAPIPVAEPVAEVVAPVVVAAPVAAPVVAPAPEVVAPVVVAAPAVAAPAPVRAPEPAMAMAETAAVVGDSDTISSIITALGTGTGAKADVVDPTPRNDPSIVENFYESVARHCDLAMLITDQGDVVQFSDSAAGWFDIGPDISRDMKAWVAETAKIMPGCQLVVMRSPILQNQSVIFMTNGSVTAFGAFSSHVTGRIFSIANEFVGRRR